MKKILIYSIFMLTIIFSSSCKQKDKPIDVGVVDLKYYDETNEEIDYNDNLFYRNDLLDTGADPDVIYITEGEYKGKFFLYPTSDEIGCLGIQAWMSDDLISWEFVSTAFFPDQESWGVTSLWAPNVVYDEETSLYYMYYSAANSNQEDGYYNKKYIGVATSTKPTGPFTQYTGINLNGTEITIKDPIFDPAFLEDDSEFNPKNVTGGQGFIDAFSYIDPISGKHYLYMVKNSPNEICVVEMKDYFTPDYSTFKLLTRVNYTTIEKEEETELYEGTIDEAPIVIYHEGLYYLTMSINGATDKNYGVIQAISENPDGPYRKIQASEGGLVLSAEHVWDHASCCGSHSLVEVEGELYIVYHQDRDRDTDGSFNRGFALDKIFWIKGNEGFDLMKSIGPTWSVQPLPSFYTGYKNIAYKANLDVTGTASDSDKKYLNDGAVRLHEVDIVNEFYGENTIKITMTFDEYETIRSLLIYNSCYYEYAFYQIQTIDFSFKDTVDGKDVTGIARISDVYYDFDKYANIYDEIMRPAAPIIFEFDELECNKIEITLSVPEGQDLIGINEIMVLGKEE